MSTTLIGLLAGVVIYLANGLDRALAQRHQTAKLTTNNPDSWDKSVKKEWSKRLADFIWDVLTLPGKKLGAKLFGPILLAIALAVSWLIDRICTIWEDISADEYPYPPVGTGRSNWED
ncbi:MAG: hypothetical protein WCW26_00260 [Candidatus Buchananbacteria bacterium]